MEFQGKIEKKHQIFFWDLFFLIIFYKSDVRKYESCQNVLVEGLKYFGVNKLDILVNGAAGNFLCNKKKNDKYLNIKKKNIKKKKKKIKKKTKK